MSNPSNFEQIEQLQPTQSVQLDVPELIPGNLPIAEIQNQPRHFRKIVNVALMAAVLFAGKDIMSDDQAAANVADPARVSLGASQRFNKEIERCEYNVPIFNGITHELTGTEPKICYMMEVPDDPIPPETTTPPATTPPTSGSGSTPTTAVPQKPTTTTPKTTTTPEIDNDKDDNGKDDRMELALFGAVKAAQDANTAAGWEEYNTLFTDEELLKVLAGEITIDQLLELHKNPAPATTTTTTSAPTTTTSIADGRKAPTNTTKDTAKANNNKNSATTSKEGEDSFDKEKLVKIGSLSGAVAVIGFGSAFAFKRRKRNKEQ